jgi:hypothetical protein
MADPKDPRNRHQRRADEAWERGRVQRELKRRAEYRRDDEAKTRRDSIEKRHALAHAKAVARKKSKKKLVAK